MYEYGCRVAGHVAELFSLNQDYPDPDSCLVRCFAVCNTLREQVREQKEQKLLSKGRSESEGSGGEDKDESDQCKHM